MPIQNEAAVGAPGGRGAGEPLDLARTSPRDPGGAACRRRSRALPAPFRAPALR